MGDPAGRVKIAAVKPCRPGLCVPGFLAALPDPTFILDHEAEVIHVNAAFTELTGFGTAAAQLGPQWWEVVAPVDRARVEAAWRAHRAGGGPIDLSARLRPAGGGTLPALRLRVCASSAANWSVGVLSDLESLHETQRELRERARLLEMTDALMQVGHWHVFADTGALYWSDEVHRIHGTDPETYAPRLEDGVDAYHPDDRPRVRRAVEEALARGEAFELRARVVQPSGTIRHVLSAGGPAGPGSADLFGVIQDITSSVELQARLAESEERHALAVDGGRVGLWDWGIRTGRLWWSDRLCEICGLAPAEFDPRFESFEARLHPGDRRHVRDAVEACHDRGAGFDLEYRLWSEAGHWVWVRARGRTHFDDDGRPLRMVGTVSDISAEKAARDLLAEQTTELEARNDELNRFAAVASHDLREPLRKIATFTDRVISRGGVSDDRSLDYLRRSRAAAGRLQDMVSDLLEVTRVPTQARAVEVVNLRVALAVACSELGDGFRHAELDVGPLPSVSVNPVLLRQLLQNLLENAVKYRDPARRLRIEVREVSGPAGFAAVEIADNGIGFEPIYAERIFRLFERLHGKTTYSGTGLGLALCARVVEAYGGRIFARGEAGVGASFTFSLPRAPRTET